MKRIYRLSAVVPLFVLVALAQDDTATQKVKIALPELEYGLKQAKGMVIGGAVMGQAVRNAPYSAVEVTESTQMLADGTRIHRENQVPVYRDSEGRVRRENSPDQVMIWDPVANTSYLLNPQTQTARKMPLGMNFAVAGQKVTTDRVVTFKAGPGVLPPPSGNMMFTQSLDTGGMMVHVVGAEGKLAPKSESLGKQMMEGVNVEGTRMTSTLEAGAIGNDRPIQISSESWYSPELQTLVKSVHNDPRMGQDVFQLTNISRAEPPSTLFLLPAEYQLVEPKLPPPPPLPGGRGSVVR